MERDMIIQSRIIEAASFDEGEIEVSNILLNLKDLIKKSESRSRVLKLLSSKTKSFDRNFQAEEEETNNVEIESNFIEHLNSEGISPKKTREELMCDIKTFTRNRESLKWGLKSVEKHYNHQKAYNLELKAIKEKVMPNLNGQGLGNSTAQNLGSSMVQSHKFQYPMGPMLQAQPIPSSANGLGFVNHRSPIGTPDLNVTLVEAFTFEHSMGLTERKAQYAEARRKRMMKRKKLRD